jgi:septal ring factor EnvC (AmiA/AmiB activator)
VARISARSRDIDKKLATSLLVPILGLTLSLAGYIVTLVKSKNHPPPTYDAQIKSLDQTRASIEQLMQFIDTQRQQLAASQQALASMQSEEDRMKPLVAADRKVIDAIFAAQEGRNAAAQSHERWLGFAMGICTSLIATFLWSIGSILHRRRNPPAMPPPANPFP